MNLYDADTTECLGTATPAQINASDEAGETGIIEIDESGAVLSQYQASEWRCLGHTTCRAYVA